MAARESILTVTVEKFRAYIACVVRKTVLRYRWHVPDTTVSLIIFLKSEIWKFM